MSIMIGITVFASRTISPVPDISRYGSEGPSASRDRRARSRCSTAADCAALAGPHVRLRRVAARGGAVSLPRQGPASSCGSPGRATIAQASRCPRRRRHAASALRRTTASPGRHRRARRAATTSCSPPLVVAPAGYRLPTRLVDEG